jgi:hypothetical protein
MRIAATIVLLPLTAFAVGCGSPKSRFEELDFAEPNQLVGKEINQRIEQIPYQHREELFNNLLWLAQQGEQAIVLLLDGLEDQNPKVRSSVAWVLGRIGDRRTIEFMQPLLGDDNEAVRFEVARALVAMGDLSATPSLIEGLDSEKIEVRYGCHEALKLATRHDFQYDHLEEDVAMRSEAVLRWRQWWSSQSNDPWFAKEYANAHGLSAPGVQGGGADDGFTGFGGDDELETGVWGTPAVPAGETAPNQPGVDDDAGTTAPQGTSQSEVMPGEGSSDEEVDEPLPEPEVAPAPSTEPGTTPNGSDIWR